jgi:hypothetical protein
MITGMSVPGPTTSTAVLVCQRDTCSDVREGNKATTFDPDGTDGDQLHSLAQCMRDAGSNERRTTLPPECPAGFRSR